MNSAITVDSVREFRLGQNIRFDAWLYSMLMDNNIAYGMNPDIVASQEQMAFMVSLVRDQVYLPCSDTTFKMLCQPTAPEELQRQYNRSWRIIMRLVRSFTPEGEKRRRILQFCRFRFNQYISQHTLIPSRLVKRMTDLVLAQGNQLDDPWRQLRRASTKRQLEMLTESFVRDNLEAMPADVMADSIATVRRKLDYVELSRLLCLSAMSRPWVDTPPDAETVRKAMDTARETCAHLRHYFEASAVRSGTVLFLCDADGGVVFYLAVANSLIRMGHKVIFAVKSGFFF